MLNVPPVGLLLSAVMSPTLQGWVTIVTERRRRFEATCLFGLDGRTGATRLRMVALALSPTVGKRRWTDRRWFAICRWLFDIGGFKYQSAFFPLPETFGWPRFKWRAICHFRPANWLTRPCLQKTATKLVRRRCAVPATNMAISVGVPVWWANLLITAFQLTCRKSAYN